MRCDTISVVLLMVTIGATVTLAEERTWTDRTGKFSTVAEFVELVDGKVKLKKTDGKTVTLPLERLSEDDQQYVQDLVDAETDADTGSTARPAARANNVINSVRGAVYRTQSLSQMRQIALAIMNYQAARNRFPTQSTNAQTPDQGLSWRVAILPYIEQKALYDQFHLNEPWDSEHNLRLVDQMPDLFRSPGAELDDGFTNYVAVVAENSVITNQGQGARLQDIRDGTSMTAMVVEADDTHAVIWTKPEDYPLKPEAIAEGIGHIWTGQFCAAFADGAVRFVPLAVGGETLRAIFTRNGGERVDLSQF